MAAACAVVDVGGGVQAEAASAGGRGCTRGRTAGSAPGRASMEAKRPGKSGRYFRVLNCASEYGLSLLTWGRQWDWMTPRSASRNATGLEVIEEPRSAWMVSWPAADALLGAGGGDELLGQGGGLAGGDHPADGVAGVDVEDHVEVVVRPFRRAVQLGDVPGPDLVRPGGEQLGLHRGGVGGLRGGARGSRRPRAAAGRRWTASPGRCPRPAGSPTPRPGARSANRGACSASRIAWPLGRGQGAGLGPVPVRHRRRPGRGRAGPVAAVPAGLRHARRRGTPPGCRSAAPAAVIASVGHGVGPARCPRPRRASPRAPEVLPGPPPRSGTWPAPAPAGPSPCQPGDLRVPRIGRRAAPRLLQPGQRPGVRARRHSRSGLEYRPSRRRIAPFSPVGRRVVLGQDLLLVLRGERPPACPLRHLRIRTPCSSRQPPDQDRRSPAARSSPAGHRHLGKVSIPALGGPVIT